MPNLPLAEANNTNSSKSPKQARSKEPESADETELIGADAKLFRSVAAILNYMSIDRPDVQYAVKETARLVAKPRVCDWRPLRKIARYLIHRPRVAMIFNWQRRQSQIDGYTDSDWAGCSTTCKSTPGGVLMIGRHLLKTYSRQQKTIALSSAEAELYGMTACSSELLGMQACAADLGMKLNVSIYADASAALGIVQRLCIGRVRHVKTQSLWLQEAHAQRRIAFEKVDGSRNPADLLTKHMTELLLDRHMAYINCVPEDGRASTAPTLGSPGLNTLTLYGYTLTPADKSTTTTKTTTPGTTTTKTTTPGTTPGEAKGGQAGRVGEQIYNRVSRKNNGPGTPHTPSKLHSTKKKKKTGADSATAILNVSSFSRVPLFHGQRCTGERAGEGARKTIASR